MRKFRENCSENFVRLSEKTKITKNWWSHNSTMIDQLRPETNITKEEYERFWTPVWGNVQEFEHGGTWVNEFDKAVSSGITHQSTDEIKVPKKMVTDKVK